MECVDFLIVGGGIVGLATAAALSPFGSTALLERRKQLIEETSSRNSGVVHSGLYYPSSSLKTHLSMSGNANIWRLQKRFPSDIRAMKTGKWIGACHHDEIEVLQHLTANMAARGIEHTFVSKAERAKEEPLVRMCEVVNAVNTGIIDVHSLKDFFVRVIEGSGNGFITCDTDVFSVNFSREHKASSQAQSLYVQCRSTSKDEYSIGVSRALVCSVGLHMNEFWSRICLDTAAYRCVIPLQQRLHYCKGRYTSYRGPALVHRLVYPGPFSNLVGLGVHSVVDMAGQVRFGPDAQYVDREDDYSLFRDGDADAERAFLDSQWEAIRRYIPSVERARLSPDFSGLRPKLAGPGQPFRDFELNEIMHFTSVDRTEYPGAPAGAVLPVLSSLANYDENVRLPRVVVLNGIESPGLTASTAIADRVARALIPEDVRKAAPESPWSE